MGNIKPKHILTLIGTIIVTAANIFIAINGKSEIITIIDKRGEEQTIDNEVAQKMVDENDNLKEENTGYESKIKKLSSEIKDLSGKNNDKDSIISQMKIENEDLKNQVDGFNEQVEGLQNQVQVLESENENLRKQIENAESSNSESMPSVGDIGDVEFSKISDILYDGSRYAKYNGDSDNGFWIGGKVYYIGFAINTYLDNNRGFVYFNLEKKYSKIKFDVGRSNETKGNATLVVTSTDGLRKNYDLAGDTPWQHIEIELEGANDLTIKLVSNTDWLEFGFFNVYLTPVQPNT